MTYPFSFTRTTETSYTRCMTRKDICIICGKRKIENNIGVRGRPKRYCSAACTRNAKTTPTRYCQGCGKTYTPGAKTTSYCQDCDPAALAHASYRRCASCGTAFEYTNSNQTFCSTTCASQARGPRPTCQLPGCSEPVMDGTSTNYWPKFCSQDHRIRSLTGAAPERTNASMQRTYSLWDFSSPTPPLDPWNRPWLCPHTHQTIFTPSHLTKERQARIAQFRSIITYMNVRTNWETIDTPTKTAQPNKADWMWLIGPRFYDDGFWPWIPWIWDDIPRTIQRLALLAVKTTQRSPGYQRSRPEVVSEHEFRLEELRLDIAQASPKRKLALQAKADKEDAWLERYANGQYAASIATLLAKHQVPMPAEHYKMTEMELESLYRKRCSNFVTKATTATR